MKMRFVIVILILVSTSLGCQYSLPTSGYIQGKQVEYSEDENGHPDKKKEDKDCIHQLKIGWRSCRAKWYVVNKEDFDKFKVGDKYPWEDSPNVELDEE